MEYNPETFSCGVRYKMAEMKLKDRQVHEATGISRNTIASHRNGNSKMVKLDTLNKLCQFLRCTPNELFREPPKEWQ
ncbi:helix-turn-helix domain-containing protein [Liquorilactobacillus satsumensis]|uniref:helix-turn-helix domain-containing protein n=1 Tax=Liquorilactobacillus satsumensis TaxID=259059 RepID=UPI0039E7B519